jgi:hypothetical protein
MKLINICATVLLAASSLIGALTEGQRVQDFEYISGLYAKSYGPATWKIEAIGFNLFSTSDWLKRVRAAKSDLEHMQVLIEYVASLQDTHTHLTMSSGFLATLGFRTDLYDGKVIVELIDRALLPIARFPFGIGDELVSIDSRPALEVGRELSRNMGWGNPRATLRWAVRNIAFRPQYTYPFAVDLPDESVVVVRRQSGNLETYRIRWNKTGTPIRDLGTAPMPGMLSSGISFSPAVEEEEMEENPLKTERPALWKVYYELQQYAVPTNRVEANVRGDDGMQIKIEMVRGYGNVTPIWGLPDGFQVRVGRNPNDFMFTGTYIRDGLRIGFLRLRNFGFDSPAQLNQLTAEIQYLNANTDGLVLDVMRNTGGSGCAVVNTMALVTPGSFVINGTSLRPRPDMIRAYDDMIAEARAARSPNYVIESMEFERGLLLGALENGRGMTGPIPVCALDFTVQSSANAYTKPIILLVDDFSTSAADMFPSVFQDNNRGKLVGMRTNGAGGSIVGPYYSPWSMSPTTLTQSLGVRSIARRVDGFPENPFIENVGVRPDIELDYMTIENLRQNGRPFVEAFTNIIVNEIRASRP